MKILFVAGREASYSRSRIVVRALQDHGHEVVVCLPPDKSFKHYPALLLRTMLKAPACDVVLVGFYGQLLMPIVRLLTWKTIVFDMYITTYDTMVNDRAVAKAGSPKARLYAFFDWLSYRCARLSILDSLHVISHFGNYTGASTTRFRRLFLAVDESVIYPRPATKSFDTFRVHFHGEFIPFHGVRHIIHAAKLLDRENVSFQIVGRGQTYDEDMRLMRELGVGNITMLEPVPYAGLADHMANADVCLGIFGDNLRAELVLTNKVNEAIGMGKPLITRRNQPVQELLTHGKDVLLVDPADPRAIADAILLLKNDPSLREALGRNALDRFRESGTIAKLGEGLDRILREALGRA